MEKVFCIGLNRTGTKTFAEAMRILGYRSAPWSPRALQMYFSGDRKGLDLLIERYDAFDDWPWPLMARELIVKYPTARFVITRRKSPQAWLNSIKNHALATPRGKRTRELVFGRGSPHEFEEEYLKFYLSFYAELERMVRDLACSDRVLCVCWEFGSEWKELCRFLGKPVPELRFPHLNGSVAQIG